MGNVFGVMHLNSPGESALGGAWHEVSYA